LTVALVPVTRARRLSTVERERGSTMDIDDIKAALDAFAEAKALIQDLDIDGVKDAVGELVESSPFAEEIIEDLEGELAGVEESGANEGEHEEHHAGWLEGYQAAIDHIRDQYV
jgi:hypothetical protein